MANRSIRGIKNLFLPKKKPTIEFYSHIEGLFDLEHLRPQKGMKHIPEEYHSIPSNYGQEWYKHDAERDEWCRTAKQCPSFVDVFREGYVIVAPCDIWLWTDGDAFKWKTALDFVNISIHADNQLKDYFQDSTIKKIFKIDNVWKIRTPKGYSIRQIPLFYHFNPDWQVAYGLINTDTYHELNVQIIFTSEKEEVFIKQGDPLCYIVPFKREKLLDMEITEYSYRDDVATAFANKGTFLKGYKEFRRLKENDDTPAP